MSESRLTQAACVALVLVVTCFKNSLTAGCDHVISSDSGWFASPNFPMNFPPNQDCTWLINATQPIFISFTHLEIIGKYTGGPESLKFYDGSTTSSPILMIASLNYPHSFVSTSNQILAKFRSGTDTFSGFNVTYSPCQKLKSNESGWITTPNYPENYPIGANRCWLFSGTEPILFSFPHLHLEENVDWLRIYNGPTTDDKEYQRASTTPYFPIVTSANQVLVTFTSSGRTYSGFNVTYSPFRCNHVLSADSGTLTSPNYPQKYPQYANCSWLINSTQPISLAFTAFELGLSQSLKIYDGPTPSSPLLLSASGDNATSIFSTSNQVLVTFESGSGYSFAGFNAFYSPIVKCEEIISESGWITSPNYPNAYPDNSNICWLIKGKHPIALSIIDFRLDRNGDSIAVYDGPTIASPLLKKTGWLPPDFSLIVSTSNSVLINFISDGSKSGNGFKMTFSPYKCHQAQLLDSGTFDLQTNAAWNPNRNISWSCWLINSTEPIKLKFNLFGVDKYEDNLWVYDGPTKSSPLLLETSSNKVYSLTSVAHQVLVTFASTQFKSNIGFNATYSHARCQNILSSESGWFMSPNHPENYPHQSDLCWLIMATNPVMLTFPRFHLETNKDWITIYDGETETFPVLLKSSTNETVPSSIVSTSHQILVVFTTDSSGSFSGFNATYQPYYPGITTRPQECTETIHVDSTGFVLTSLNYPISYPNVRCNWQFFSDEYTTLQITFTDFSTRPEDYVSVYREGRSTYYNSLMMLASGIDASSPLSCNYGSITSNKLLVAFNPFSETVRSKRMPKAGFRAIITPSNAPGCGGHYNRSVGDILLGFPEMNNVHHFKTQRCIWKIEVEEGSQVNLTVNKFIGPGAEQYSLEIHEGVDELASLSGYSPFEKSFFVMSRSNQITVVLKDNAPINFQKMCQPRDYPKLKFSYTATNSSTFGCYGRMDINTRKLSPLPELPHDSFAPDSLTCKWKTGNSTFISVGDITNDGNTTNAEGSPSYDYADEEY